MRIAQIAPLAESCPPQLYGGTERIVSYLTEALVRQGHDVTLFASGDSSTSARLESCSRRALRLDPKVRDPLAHHLVMMDRVRRRAGEFDILHFHTEILHYPLIRDFSDRTLTTLHGRLDLPDLDEVYAAFFDIPLVSISRSQRTPFPRANWVGTVPHGLPPGLLSFNPSPRGDYLAFLGRISPEKGPDRAIEIAKHSGMKLKMAAKVDRAEEDYWRRIIQPMIAENPNIEFVGEIDEKQKAEFLGNARAVLFPICWQEPFGLVMIEAMACGTPVIAFRIGSAPEVVEHGVSGFLVDDIEEAIEAVNNLSRLDRMQSRRLFEERFTVERMTRDYLALYRARAGSRVDVPRRRRGASVDLQVVA
jgi:glycosyltransferase involved in cell wall biosynthesis